MNREMKTAPLAVLCVLIIASPSVWANWVPNGAAICAASGDQGFPTITSDGAGGAIVTWMDQRSGNYDIYAQRVNPTGALKWTVTGVALCTATGHQEYPTIIPDGAGGAIVTWMDYRSGNGNIYAQRVNASGSVLWAANGVALSAAAGNKWYPAIISDGAGGAVVTWYDYRSGSGDIYAQRVNASGVVQWTTDGVALCTATGNQVTPGITSDGANGAIVAWDDSRSGTEDIYAQRVNASGAVQWTADGVPLCTAMNMQQLPTIVSDGAGGAVVAWQDYRSGSSYGIYAQRVNASGAVQWIADGVPLCTSAGSQDAAAITSDGAGGAIVAWRDYRSGSNFDIYAQRVNASGSLQWTGDGVALCTAAGDQAIPKMVSDGGGGAIVTWWDYRGGNDLDIYAQKLNASGVVRWMTDGVALCTAAGRQYHSAITSDGASGAIVTWDDNRNGTNFDIYGLRVDANGFAVLTGTDAPGARVELHQNYPNPFNPATTVSYSVSERCNVTLKIYDVSGKCIASLVDGQQEKGSYAVEWNGKDDKGNSVASGIYLYRLGAGNQTISRKMVLLR